MSLALFICELFISLMRSVNGAQFLKPFSLSTLFGIFTVYSATVIFLSTGIYASLESHKLDLTLKF